MSRFLEVCEQARYLERVLNLTRSQRDEVERILEEVWDASKEDGGDYDEGYNDGWGDRSCECNCGTDD